jgi:hypothetical protein
MNVNIIFWTDIYSFPFVEDSLRVLAVRAYKPPELKKVWAAKYISTKHWNESIRQNTYTRKKTTPPLE